MTDFRDVRVIADAGDGADIENMRVVNTGSAVTVVQPDYAQQVGKTTVIVAHGLVVLPRSQLTAETAKAYKEHLPDALRRAGVLVNLPDGVFAGVDVPPRDGGTINRDGMRRPLPHRSPHGERPSVLQHVLDALSLFRRGVFDLERRFGA